MNPSKHGRTISPSDDLEPNRPLVRSPVSGGRRLSLLAPARQFDPDSPELADRPGIDPSALREEFKALETLNQRLGAYKLVLWSIKRYLKRIASPSFSILDLGTGSADIPRAIVEWARKQKLSVTICAIDGNSEIVRMAGEACAAWPEIKVEQHDLRALPYEKESFDLVHCSLALHHFSWTDAVSILRRMHELARVGFIVNDLRRNWVSVGTMELLAPLLCKSGMFSHDAVKSCKAAFTVRELRAIAREAGLGRVRIHREHACFRMVLEGKK